MRHRRRDQPLLVLVGTAAFLALLLLPASGCASRAPLPVPDAAFFQGEYRGSARGGLAASLTVAGDLSYVYVEDRGRVHRIPQRVLKGRLRFTDERTARAGTVILLWQGANRVEVRSPFDASVQSDGLGGQVQSGRSFVLTRSVPRTALDGATGTITLELTPARDCYARVSSSHVQMDDKVRIDATIENEDCAASSGEFVVHVRTAGEGLDSRTRRFRETWSREDAAPVEATRIYDIGAGQRVEWVQVAAPRNACRCAVEAADAEAPD